MRYRRMGVALVAALVGVWAVPARGSFHEWRISEIYSNASGSVQFIEFLQPAEEFDDERFLLGQTLTDSAEVIYQMNEFFAPGYATGVRYNDPAFGISWPLPVTIISERDATWPLLKD